MERQSLVLSVEPENLQLLQRLLTQVLQTEKWEDESFAQNLTWIICEREEVENDEFYEVSQLIDSNGDFWPLTPRLLGWKEALWSHFALSAERGSYELRDVEAYDMAQHQKLKIEMQKPTVQEILESHLALREWVASIGNPPHFLELLALDEK